jgi:hypothetical protein
MIERFKAKWNIKSNFQLVLILMIFSLTGSTTLYIRKGVFYLLGISADTELWLRTVLYILTIVPSYYIMLLVVSFVFGQFKFAWQFEKMMLQRFKFNKK